MSMAFEFGDCIWAHHRWILSGKEAHTCPCGVTKRRLLNAVPGGHEIWLTSVRPCYLCNHEHHWLDFICSLLLPPTQHQCSLFCFFLWKKPGPQHLQASSAHLTWSAAPITTIVPILLPYIAFMFCLWSSITYITFGFILIYWLLATL